MLLQMNGIGNQKIEYKNHSEIEFDSLKEYITMAKKTISKFANKIYTGLASKMLKDEDAISNVANAIMMADWRWDENYQNDKGTKKTKYSYRNQCALWAIQTYATKNSKRPKNVNKVYSLNHDLDNDETSDMYHFTEDKTITSPEDILMENEDKTVLANLIDNLLSLECLSDRQKDYIKLYYFEDHTFDKIGKKYGITREAVRQGLNKALNIIRETVQ
jgi:RNA polymerase sigma factor (sigma-70 family)